MTVEDLLKSIFNSNKEEKTSGPSLVEQINRHMALLVDKSGNLNDSFEAEKKEIKAVAEEAASIKESKEILAAKLEQDILGKVTAVSSAFELALSGKATVDAVKKEIASLKAKISQRSALK